MKRTLLTLAAVAANAIPASATPTVAPYIQGGTQTTMSIMWQSDRPTAASVRVTDAQGRPVPAPSLATPEREHLFRLTGLTPGSEYRYQALENGQPVGSGSFHTNPGPETSHFRFAVLGDSGSGNANQYAVAKQLIAWKPEFVLHTGDVVYEKGEASDYPSKFYKPYHALIANTMIYLSPGNHDYGSEHARAYVEAIDAPRAHPGDPERWYTFSYGDAQFFALDSISAFDKGTPQYTWLAKELAASRAPWKFAYFHHPFYSSGWEGSSPWLRKAWAPLFERHHVQVVFNGHDHDYERIKPMNGVQYIVTGGGGAWLRNVHPHDFTVAWKKTYHFLGVTMEKDTATLEAIDTSGAVFDRAVVHR